ncbi:MAG TPA: twin-arginine translocation signal domain-containing protein, partial [Burkholderiaceae bacterium]|nr:twin-arginine translocation signal domain-containing protein [Burkholderiaceae bacterium]
MRIEWMNDISASVPELSAGAGQGLSRRNFMKAAGVLGGGLVLGFFVPGANRFANAQAPKAVYAPNAFLRIAPDNTITVAVNRLEFGQGVNTAL